MRIRLTESCLIALALLVQSGCEPESAPARDQWIVLIGTDAPVPQLGDRLVVEVLDASGELSCSACRRQFSVASDSDWPVSFGVVPTGDELLVRAELFRADHIGFDGLPMGTAHLEAIAKLPEPSGVTTVTMNLDMACFGVPAARAARESCGRALTTLTGGAAVATPNSWQPAERIGCRGNPPAGTVCVPGGVFLLGSVHGFGTDEQPERLVRVSPFAMDVREVTVGDVKKLFEQQRISREPLAPSPDTGEVDNACRYLPASAANDEFAVNCLDQQLAREICDARGMRLPREAEWEWAAGNLERETTYPWGENDELCDLAVVGRGRLSTEGFGEPDNCRGEAGAEGVPWGPAIGGDGDDVTELGIENLGGNMSEWIEDADAPYDDPCWSPELTLLEDPLCQNLGQSAVNRGAGWASYPLQARVFERNAIDRSATPTNTGLRCVLSMGPQ